MEFLEKCLYAVVLIAILFVLLAIEQHYGSSDRKTVHILTKEGYIMPIDYGTPEIPQLTPEQKAQLLTQVIINNNKENEVLSTLDNVLDKTKDNK